MIWSAPSQVTPPAPSSVKSPPSIPDDRRYGFDKAELGMSLGDWRRLSTRQATAVCVGQGAGGQAITCSTQNVSLGGSYWARNPTYKFLDGRLVGIAFQTSIDGFDFATAALKRSFGEPNRIVRDMVKLQDGAVFPHVMMTWGNGRSTIALSDPVMKGMTLSVQFSLNGAGPQIFKAI